MKNSEQYRKNLISVIKLDDYSKGSTCKQLDNLYKEKLEPLREKMGDGILPSSKERNLVSKIENEIREIGFGYFPQTTKSVNWIRNMYGVVELDLYVRNLKEKWKKAKNELLNSKDLTPEEIKKLQKKMRNLSEKLIIATR